MQYNNFILIRISERLEIQNLAKCFRWQAISQLFKIRFIPNCVVIQIDYWSYDVLDKLSSAHVCVLIIDLLYWFFSKKETSSNFDPCN